MNSKEKNILFFEKLLDEKWESVGAEEETKRGSRSYIPRLRRAKLELTKLNDKLKKAKTKSEKTRIERAIRTMQLRRDNLKRNLKRVIDIENWEMDPELEKALRTARATEIGSDVIKEQCKITNNSTKDLSQLENIVSRFYPYVKEKLGFDQDTKVNLISDPENAKDPWGKTAYYDPEAMKITIFVDNRHPKDMLRSLSHELVHHAQNCRGEFKDAGPLPADYAQRDPHMRRMEGEAYLLGSGFLIRDFLDSHLNENQNLMENKKMKRLTKKQLKTVLENTIKRVIEENNIEEAQWEREHVRLPGGSYGRPGSNKPEVDLRKRYSGLDKEECKRQGYMLYDPKHDKCYNIGEGKIDEEEGVCKRDEDLEEETINETFTSKKDHMLFETLTKKWAK